MKIELSHGYFDAFLLLPTIGLRTIKLKNGEGKAYFVALFNLFVAVQVRTYSNKN